MPALWERIVFDNRTKLTIRDRVFRLTEPSWIASGSISLDSPRVNFEYVLEQSGIPQNEIRFIMDEIAHGFPWSDELYSERRV